ncbi:MAG: hypothetical protein K6F34_11020, partial [Lachnospiraceae bacterium]|nr:hypothetical protein [Lachnospiraceae bacterium]
QVSGNGLTDNTVSGNTVSGNSVSENSVSENEIDSGSVSSNEVGDPEGAMYPGEDHYRITFAGKNNGITKVLRIYNTTTESMTLRKYVSDMGLWNAIVNYGFKDEEGSLVDTANGESIAGWDISVDGVYDKTVDYMFTYDENDTNYDYLIYPGKDYYLTACVKKKLANNLYIDCIPAVYYTGRAHVTRNTQAKGKFKSMERDIVLNVSDSDGKNLTPGKDYTVKYKNNKEASMKMDDGNNGVFLQKYDDLSKRPYMIITGKGNYKGFSAKAYFDIYPYNFGKQDPHVEISGLKNTYTLKNGKISGFKEPKITLKHPGLKTKTLKEGRDYEVVVHRYVPDMWSMFDSSGIKRLPGAGNLKEEGQYLYAVRGKGNYCGIFGGQRTDVDFSPNTPYPFLCKTYTEECAPWQFKITNDTKFDFANARVVIKHPTVNYDFDNTKAYNSDIFGITVQYKDGNVWKDYSSNAYDIYYIGKSYDYIYGIDSLSDNCKAVIRKTDNVNKAYVSVAGEYKVVVKARPENYDYFHAWGSVTAKQKVKLKGTGINYKKLKKTTIKYNGAPSTATDLEAAYSKKGLKFVMNPKYAVGSHLFVTTPDYEGIYRSHYLKNVYIHDQIDPRIVCPVNTVNDTMPGTYKNELIAVGGGLDHDKPFVRKYKRVGIKLKEAEKTNNPETGMILFSASCAAASSFNVAGAYPQDLKIYFNGHMNDFSYYGQNKPMYYNGQVYTLEDKDGNKIKVKIRAYNNTRVGKAYFVVEGDGKVFKGKSSKFYYDVVERGYTGIPVKNSDYWYVDHGKQIPLTLKKGEGYAGFIYATMSPGKKYKGGLPKKRDVKLYQAYYKNAADLAKDKKTLKRIDPKYYSLSFYKTENNNYTVKVSKGKKAGFNWQDSSVLDKPYTLYDKAVKITSITVWDTITSQQRQLPSYKKNIALYTGRQIRPGVINVVLSNGKVLNTGEFDVEYGSNITAGKKTGTIRIILKQQSDYKFYYGGSKTFYFNIAGHGSETL